MPIYYNEAQRLYFLFPAFVLAAVEIVYPSTDKLNRSYYCCATCVCNLRSRDHVSTALIQLRRLSIEYSMPYCDTLSPLAQFSTPTPNAVSAWAFMSPKGSAIGRQ